MWIPKNNRKNLPKTKERTKQPDDVPPGTIKSTKKMHEEKDRKMLHFCKNFIFIHFLFWIFILVVFLWPLWNFSVRSGDNHYLNIFIDFRLWWSEIHLVFFVSKSTVRQLITMKLHYSQRWYSIADLQVFNFYIQHCIIWSQKLLTSSLLFSTNLNLMYFVFVWLQLDLPTPSMSHEWTLKQSLPRCGSQLNNH